MKIFMIGGTGLLGSEAARILIEKGHEVTSIALPPLPSGASIPPKLKIEFNDYLKMSDDELRRAFKGCDGFVFAAGVDERLEGPPPIYEMFVKYNNDPLKRILNIAKESGVKHCVILGSYFSYFHKVRPQLELTKWHPYIRSRIEQELLALSFADDNFNVAILELPYIFGTQKGRKPVWVFLVEMLLDMKKATFYPGGGTTMVTIRQVGEAVLGALEKNKGGVCYPIGYYNLKWKEMLSIFNKYMGVPDKKIITIPKWLFKMSTKKMVKDQKKKNIEGGLYLPEFVKMQCSNQFIDKSLGCDILGVTDDDIEKAIGESVLLSLEVINKKTEVIEMKGE